MPVARPEQEIHKAVVQHLRLRGVKDMVFFHPPNGAQLGGKKNRKGIAIQGSIFVSLGVRAGASDLIIVHQGKVFALELKAEGGRTRENQLEFLADIGRAGAFTAIATGIDQAIATLETWGLLRGVTT